MTTETQSRFSEVNIKNPLRDGTTLTPDEVATLNLAACTARHCYLEQLRAAKDNQGRNFWSSQLEELNAANASLLGVSPHAR